MQVLPPQKAEVRKPFKRLLHEQGGLYYFFFFHPFQSNGEKETEKTQGTNPLSTQAPFMRVLG